MESDGDDLENIFEEYENDAEAENTENKTANETPGAVKIAAPKRIVRNPRLKFNAERLCGERGIPVLVDHFKNVKFKGQGHEKEDLDKLLSKLEHWTHRLFPSMKFEDCLTHIERLGKKRLVQTCLRKIRLDMPILSSDFVKDNDEEDVKRNMDSEPEEMNAFDRLLGESQEISNINTSVSENVSNTSFSYSSPVINDTSAHILGSFSGPSLTEEQKERMERNKMLAAERRKARLAAVEQNTVEPQSESHASTLSGNVFSQQNPFDKLLDSTDCIEKNENKNSDLESSQDIDKSSKNSSNLAHDHSEELGLDDLMDLVDEEEPIVKENAISSSSDRIAPVSSYVNETNNNQVLSDSTENFKNFQSVSDGIKSDSISTPKESESLKENLNMEPPFDLICETPVNSGETSVNNADADPSSGCIFTSDESVLMKNKDLFSMNCKNETFNNDNDNVNGFDKLSQGDVEKLKNLHSISENTENIFSGSQKSPEEISKIDPSLDLVCEAPADSEANTYTDDSVKDTSICDKNVIMAYEDVVPMDCEDGNS